MTSNRVPAPMALAVRLSTFYLVLLASAAQAQPSPSAEGPSSAPGAPTPAAAASPPAQEAPPVSEAPPPASAPPAPPMRPFPVPPNETPPEPEDWDAPRFDPPGRARRHHLEVGFGMGVPVWLTPDDGAIDPGFAFHGRIGFVAGAIVPEMTIGWQVNSVDDELTEGRDVSLDAFYMSFGVRARFDNHTMVTPFVSGSLDLNFWHLTGDDRLECGYYYCREVANYEFGPGLSLRGGVALELAPAVALDLGLRVASAFATGVFEQTEVWISPFLGLTFYN